jgi:hypothetical protein
MDIRLPTFDFVRRNVLSALKEPIREADVWDTEGIRALVMLPGLLL